MAATGETGSGGVLAAVRRLGGTVVAALETRIALLSTETEEQLVRLTRQLVFAACALVFFMLGLLVATAFVLILFWDTHRLAATGVVALLYFAGCAALVVKARQEARLRPRLLAATLTELAKDREQLKGRR